MTRGPRIRAPELVPPRVRIGGPALFDSHEDEASSQRELCAAYAAHLDREIERKRRRAVAEGRR